jgi:hypothetical protein
MELIDFLAESTDVGNFCDRVYGGITEVYLVPAGGGFSLFLKPSEILELPTLDVSPYRIVLEPESCELRCRNIFDKNGSKFENTIIFRNIRKVYEWLHENRYKSFWVILKQGETRCLVTGDDDMPYRYAADYAVEKEMQNEAAFTVSLKSTQLRPFHVIRFRFVVLDPNDWQEQQNYLGEWTLEKGVLASGNDIVTYQNSVYQKDSNRATFLPPGANEDYVFLGVFAGNWTVDSNGNGEYVEFNGKLYLHLTLTNGYTYVYL